MAATPWPRVSRSTPTITPPKATTFSPAATQSSGRSERRLSGRVTRLSRTAATPIGMFTAKSQGHVATERIMDATVGAMTEITETTMAFSPTPCPSRRDGKM